jgi:tetratricopeptide (TPR) repeat protein
VNRFRTLEAEANNLGYARLREGKIAEALALFRANTRVYGTSANTWDSLGEALAATGQTQAAIAAYRQALAIEPDLGSAREALQRLGVPVESAAQH